MHIFLQQGMYHITKGIEMGQHAGSANHTVTG
jgi:hypothetical protein